MKAAAAFLLVLHYLSVSYGWVCIEGPQQFPAVQIDAGNNKVVMRDSNNLAYFLIGSTWYQMDSVALKHVSVGPTGIWAVDLSERVCKYIAGKFVPTYGLELKQVDAGGKGQVVGVTGASKIHCLRSSFVEAYKTQFSFSWNTLEGGLMYFSCGPQHLGCWGVNSNQDIYFTKVTPSTCDISGWIHIPGKAVMAEVGNDGTVFVVNVKGLLYQRVGITSLLPQGTEWINIPMPSLINHVSYDAERLWAVTNEGSILNCTR
ncbi:fish-egg lectin-like [Pholidichthys leucotaenia]